MVGVHSSIKAPGCLTTEAFDRDVFVLHPGANPGTCWFQCSTLTHQGGCGEGEGNLSPQEGKKEGRVEKKHMIYLTQHFIWLTIHNPMSKINHHDMYTAKLLFHQSPTRHSDYTVTTTVMM